MPTYYRGVYSPNTVNPYGLHVPYTKGYDARSRGKAGRAESQGSSGNFFSATLGSQVELWITELSADFSVSGDQGQSRMLREFFPHSFNDVTITITGNVPSTQEYNRLASFVREHHWRALQAINTGSKNDQTIQFTLYDKTPKSWKGTRSVKGGHRSWSVNGYIKSMKAGAVAHEVAPEFQISFIESASTLDPANNQGLWSDTMVKPQALSSILDLVKIAQKNQRVSAHGYISNPTSVGPAIQQEAAPSPGKNLALSAGGSSGIWSVVASLSNQFA